MKAITAMGKQNANMINKYRINRVIKQSNYRIGDSYKKFLSIKSSRSPFIIYGKTISREITINKVYFQAERSQERASYRYV